MVSLVYKQGVEKTSIAYGVWFLLFDSYFLSPCPRQWTGNYRNRFFDGFEVTYDSGNRWLSSDNEFNHFMFSFWCVRIDHLLYKYYFLCNTNDS